MTLASVTPVRRTPTVTPILSPEIISVPAHRDTSAPPVIRMSTSAHWVNFTLPNLLMPGLLSSLGHTSAHIKLKPSPTHSQRFCTTSCFPVTMVTLVVITVAVICGKQHNEAFTLLFQTRLSRPNDLISKTLSWLYGEISACLVFIYTKIF